MASDIDGVIDGNKAYTKTRLAKILGYKESRSMQRELGRLGIWSTRLGRNELYLGIDIIQGLGGSSEGPSEPEGEE